VKSSETAIEPAAISIADAGRYLGVSPDTVRRLIRAGTVPHARVGSSIRIRRIDLESYLSDQTSRQWQPTAGRGRKMAAS
jgi:excisionase family DNA binding protein